MSTFVKVNDAYVEVRQGLMERVWEVSGVLVVNGFELKSTLYIRGTSNELIEYMNSDSPFEFGYSFHAVGFDEVKKIAVTNRIYIAPRIDDDRRIGNI